MVNWRSGWEPSVSSSLFTIHQSLFRSAVPPPGTRKRRVLCSRLGRLGSNMLHSAVTGRTAHLSSGKSPAMKRRGNPLSCYRIRKGRGSDEAASVRIWDGLFELGTALAGRHSLVWEGRIMLRRFTSRGSIDVDAALRCHLPRSTRGCNIKLPQHLFLGRLTPGVESP